MTAQTGLGLSGGPRTRFLTGQYDGKTIAPNEQTAILVHQFDIYRAGYAGAIVTVYAAGTTTPLTLYSDANLSNIISNPQTLTTLTIGSQTYGKFATQVYVAQAYELDINSDEQTGIENPGIRNLDREDASEAYVTSNKGGVARTLGERAAYEINVLDFGVFQEDGSPTQNTTTLQTAIGVASGQSGGTVNIPAGTFEITSITLPANVTLRGAAREATILQSQEADVVVQHTGDYATLEHLTLDGLTLLVDSVGIRSKAKEQLHLHHVEIKRFETGLLCIGGTDHQYSDLNIVNCATGADLRGDTDASVDGAGDEFRRLQWNNGVVKETTSYGVRLRYVDDECENIKLQGVVFQDNTGTAALDIAGATHVLIEEGAFLSNTVRHILIDNDASDNQYVRNIHFYSGRFNGSEIKISGDAAEVTFERARLENSLDFNMDSPTEEVSLVSCREDGTVTVSGSTTKIGRWRDSDSQQNIVSTTSSASTAQVWVRLLEPGEIVHLHVTGVARQRDADQHEVIRLEAGVECQAASLDFDGQTSNMAAGSQVLGANSGATAYIQTQTDSGASGTFNLIKIDGTFEDNEALSEVGGSGDAVVQGTLSYQDAAMIGVSKIFNDGTATGAWDIDVTTSGREAIVQVEGPTTGTVDWNVAVVVTSIK